MSTEETRALARRCFEEILGGRRTDLLDALVAPDAVDGLRAQLEWLWQNVDDVGVAVDDIVAEDGRAVVFWTLTGLHRRTLWGLPPTGRRFSGRGVSTLVVQGGRVVRHRVLADRQAVIEALAVRRPAAVARAARRPW